MKCVDGQANFQRSESCILFYKIVETQRKERTEIPVDDSEKCA